MLTPLAVHFGLARANAFFAALVAIFVVATLRAQTPATGIVEGRVLNVPSGAYLNNARVTVNGTKVETFTNETGDYRLTNVPAGEVQLVALFTGLQPQTATVTVTTAQIAKYDFNLTRAESVDE